MSDSPASILYDSQGNPVGVVLDDTIYRLQVDAKLAIGHGLATEAKQDAQEETLNSIEARADNLDVPLSTRATEGTLASADARLTTIDNVLDSIKDTDGVKKITDPVRAILEDVNGNRVTVVSDGGGLYLLRTYTKLAAGSSNVGYVGLVDKDGTHKAKVTPGGQLEIYAPAPTPPPNTEPVRISAISSLSLQVEETHYTIPNGEILVIQNFSGGASDVNRDSRVSLYYDASGAGINQELIRVAYVGNSNFDFQLGPAFTSFLGNGTIRITLRREAIDGGGREIAGFWDGYRYVA